MLILTDMIEPCSCNSQDCPECASYLIRECKTPKCQRCGRFTGRLYPVWSMGWPTPEILYEVGDCCRD